MRATLWCRRGRSVAAPLVAALTLAACASTGGGDLGRTWTAAFIAAPDAAQAERVVSGLAPLRQQSAARYPVVIYLHGCTGMGKEERQLGRELAARGYVFIAPDSMARRYRPLQCDPKTSTGGHNLFVFDFRLAEISYALQQLRDEPWVDPSNLFLIGGSEGGVAAALYRGDEFRARVIFQWTCHGAPLVRGLAAPPGTAVLAIVNRDDPWYDERHTHGQGGDCGAFFRGVGSESLVLSGLGGHDVLDRPDVRRRIQLFLDSQAHNR